MEDTGALNTEPNSRSSWCKLRTDFNSNDELSSGLGTNTFYAFQTHTDCPTIKAREVLHGKITRLFFTAHLERFFVGTSVIKKFHWDVHLNKKFW